MYDVMRELIKIQIIPISLEQDTNLFIYSDLALKDVLLNVNQHSLETNHNQSQTQPTRLAIQFNSSRLVLKSCVELIVYLLTAILFMSVKRS